MLFWFTVFSCVILGILIIGLGIWTWESIKDIASIQPRYYREATYYWICTVILFAGIFLTIFFLFPLLGWGGWFLKTTLELIAKALIH